MKFINGETVSIIAIIILVIFILHIFSRDKSFDLRNLIISPETSQPSLHKFSHFIALVISSWGFIILVLHNQLTETYFTVYMGIWAASNTVNKYLGGKSSDKNTTSN